MPYTAEQHAEHYPETLERDCSYCVAAMRASPVPLCHGLGSSSRVIPVTVKPEPDE